MLFSPSLSWASLRCQQTLFACWQRVGQGSTPGPRSALWKLGGNKTLVDSQSGKKMQTRRAVWDGGCAPGLPDSFICLLLDIGLYVTCAATGTWGSFCFSHQSPLGDPTPVGRILAAFFFVMGFCIDKANAAAEMLRSEMSAETQKSASAVAGFNT